ncbi:hypothetical protein MUP95_02345 [bacterium]|nr:hypothetical protein [bacterium]
MVEKKKIISWEEKIEQKVTDLENKVERMGKGAKTKTESAKENSRKEGHHGHTLFWGIVLIIIGIIWLGNNLKWFIYDIPWIPVIMIAGGIYIIFKNWEKEKPTGNEVSEEKRK